MLRFHLQPDPKECGIWKKIAKYKYKMIAGIYNHLSLFLFTILPLRNVVRPIVTKRWVLETVVCEEYI